MSTRLEALRDLILNGVADDGHDRPFSATTRPRLQVSLCLAHAPPCGRGAGLPIRITPPLVVSLRQWVEDAERSPVAHEPLVSLLAHFLQRLQHFRLRLWITPLLELDGPIGDIERVCPPEQPTQRLLFWPPQFRGFRHVLLPRGVSKPSGIVLVAPSLGSLAAAWLIGAIGYPRNGGKGRARTPLPPRPSRGQRQSGLSSPSHRCRRGGARRGRGVLRGRDRRLAI